MATVNGGNQLMISENNWKFRLFHGCEKKGVKHIAPVFEIAIYFCYYCFEDKGKQPSHQQTSDPSTLSTIQAEYRYGNVNGK